MLGFSTCHFDTSLWSMSAAGIQMLSICIVCLAHTCAKRENIFWQGLLRSLLSVTSSRACLEIWGFDLRHEGMRCGWPGSPTQASCCKWEQQQNSATLFSTQPLIRQSERDTCSRIGRVVFSQDKGNDGQHGWPARRKLSHHRRGEGCLTFSFWSQPADFRSSLDASAAAAFSPEKHFAQQLVSQVKLKWRLSLPISGSVLEVLLVFAWFLTDVHLYRLCKRQERKKVGRRIVNSF